MVQQCSRSPVAPRLHIRTLQPAPGEGHGQGQHVRMAHLLLIRRVLEGNPRDRFCRKVHGVHHQAQRFDPGILIQFDQRWQRQSEVHPGFLEPCRLRNRQGLEVTNCLGESLPKDGPTQRRAKLVITSPTPGSIAQRRTRLIAPCAVRPCHQRHSFPRWGRA